MSQKPIHLGWDLASGPDQTVWGVHSAAGTVTLPPECGNIIDMVKVSDTTVCVDCQFAVVTLDLSQSPPGIKVEMLPS